MNQIPVKELSESVSGIFLLAILGFLGWFFLQLKETIPVILDRIENIIDKFTEQFKDSLSDLRSSFEKLGDNIINKLDTNIDISKKNNSLLEKISNNGKVKK